MIETDKPADTDLSRSSGVHDEMSPGIPPLRLQPDAKPTNALHYFLTELVCYHDRAFVAHVYAALAKRAPTNVELARTLDDLRSGRRGKIEIIEQLLRAQVDGQEQVHVEGLPSSTLRRLSRWPLIGYVLRLLRGLTRLPVMLQHQQQFEAYALAQQQQIADYLNEVLLPTVRQQATSTTDGNLVTMVDDAVAGVMMLSDSLVELAGREAELQTQVQSLQVQHRELQAQLQQLQTQREQSEAQLHANLVMLTEKLSTQQQRHDELRGAHDEAAAGQREFLVQEQRVIVETQKVAFGELQEQLSRLSREQEEKTTELAAEVGRLYLLVEKLRAGVPASLGKQERKPT